MTSDSLRFRFKIRPIADIVPWGNQNSLSLSWFGLTDGWQCLETSTGRLLEHSQPSESGGSRWVEYQVARLFEDLLGLWPWVSDPVPRDVASRFLSWYCSAEISPIAIVTDPDIDPDNWNLWCEACTWWDKRQLHFDHLTLSPKMHLWRVESEINLLWDAPGMDAAGPRWTVQHAQVTMPFEETQKAVEDFCRALLSAMAERVGTIERDGWRRADCSLDVDRLVAEHHERQAWASANLFRVFKTDWNAVRRVQDKLKMK